MLSTFRGQKASTNFKVRKGTKRMVADSAFSIRKSLHVGLRIFGIQILDPLIKRNLNAAAAQKKNISLCKGGSWRSEMKSALKRHPSSHPLKHLGTNAMQQTAFAIVFRNFKCAIWPHSVPPI